MRAEEMKAMATMKETMIWMEYRRKRHWTKLMEEHDSNFRQCTLRDNIHYWILWHFILPPLCIWNVTNHDLYSTFRNHRKPVVSSTNISKCPVGVIIFHLSVSFPRQPSVELGHSSLLYCNVIMPHLRVARRRVLRIVGAWHRILDFYTHLY